LRRKTKKIEEYKPEHEGEEKELRREEKRNKWISMFFIYSDSVSNILFKILI
jgi:hypothetical protein